MKATNGRLSTAAPLGAAFVETVALGFEDGLLSGASLAVIGVIACRLGGGLGHVLALLGLAVVLGARLRELIVRFSAQTPMPGLPATPTSVGSLSRRGRTVFASRSQVSTTSQIGGPVAPSATGAQPPTL